MFAKRALILGEAHYQWDRSIPVTGELSQACVRAQVEGAWTKQFWTNIAVSFLGRRPAAEEKRVFWQSVAYYVFIQASVGFGARVRPTPQMWAEAQTPFSVVVEQLRPQCIIVLGYDLWRHLPQGACGPVLKGAEQPQTRWYALSGSGRTLAYAIKHPSAGFSGRYWHPFVQQAMQLAEPGPAESGGGTCPGTS